jgi:Na+/proline symporter
MIKNAALYGRQQDLFVKPIAGQPFSLVVFFNKKSIANNISRLLHFCITCLVYLFLVIGICIFLTTSAVSSSPQKLRFNVSKIEWIRPSAGTHSPTGS